mgnify:CR=1 FL=1
MSQVSRIIQTPEDVIALQNLIKNRAIPYTIAIKDGKHRTPKQNRLQHMWYQEAADQLKDHTAEEYRAYCKLHFGVGILKNCHDVFAEKYDRLIKPLPYETKLEYMQEPIGFPITSLMNTKQKTQFLDAVHLHLTERGVQMTEPEAK